MAWSREMWSGGRHRSYFILLFSIALLLCPTRLVLASDEGSTCLHRYTKQLRYDPNCNPFEHSLMRLECVAEVPLNATDITIGWFLNCEQLSDGMMSDSAQVSIEPQVTGTEFRRVRSRLTINDISDAFAGDYTCNLLGNNEYIPSDVFHLIDAMDFDYTALGECVNGYVITNPEGEKCAEITEENPIPMSLICEDTPSTSSHVVPTFTFTIPTTTHHLPSSSASFSSSSSSSSIPPAINIIHTNSPTIPAPSVGLPSSTEKTTSPSGGQDPPTSVWLYVVVAVAAVFFMIIVVLAIVCVGMCMRRSKSYDPQASNQQVSEKHLQSMRTNAVYEGDVDYTDGIQHGTSPPPPLPHVNSSPYNTLGGMGDYETIGPSSNYQRLERPTLKSGIMSRFGSNPDTLGSTATMTSVYPMLATPTKKLNGAPFGSVPPPLPSMGPPSNGGAKSIYSPESLATFESAFHSGTVDVSSPMERDRIDSTSLLLPRDRKESSNTIGTGEFEGLYIPRGQRNSPPTPLSAHPLQKIPETGASFPEPSNPHPFPISTCTYESIPEDDSNSSLSVVGAGYEKPLPSPKKSRNNRAVTLPVSPPPPEEGDHFKQNNHLSMASSSRAVTLSPRTYQEIELQSSPVYQRLESPRRNRAITKGTPSYPPVVETADFTVDSESGGTNTLTPGFPVVSADFADMPTDRAFPVSKQRPQRRQLGKEISSDCTGDSDYPRFEDLTDCTGGSTTSAYADSEWTAGSSSDTAPAEGMATFNFLRPTSQTDSSSGSARTLTPSSDGASAPNRSLSGSESSSSRHTSQSGSLTNRDTHNCSSHNGLPYLSEPTSIGGMPTVSVPNGSCTVVMAQFPHVPPGSSHTVPMSNGAAINHAQGGAPTSHTIGSPRNHYKELDPATMDPHLKYTRLHVGKLTAV